MELSRLFYLYIYLPHNIMQSRRIIDTALVVADNAVSLPLIKCISEILFAKMHLRLVGIDFLSYCRSIIRG